MYVTVIVHVNSDSPHYKCTKPYVVDGYSMGSIALKYKLHGDEGLFGSLLCTQQLEQCLAHGIF